MDLETIVITAIIIFFGYMFAKKYHLFTTNSSTDPTKKYYTADDKYNALKVFRRREIDRVLDKVSAHGINSLTRKERDLLDTYSQHPE